MLTLVDPLNNAAQRDVDEFPPLPYYPWDERPPTLPLDADESGTAIHLANGDLDRAATLLKVPTSRLARLVRAHPRLKRIQTEAEELILIRARSVPIRTLFDPNADQRALEWASTKILQSRLAIGDPLSPAPAASTTSAASLTVSPNRTITFRWRTDADDNRLSEPDADGARGAEGEDQSS